MRQYLFHRVFSYFFAAVAVFFFGTFGQVREAEAFDVYALGVGADANTLVVFDHATPGTLTDTMPVTGLGSFTLVGIDFRPATGELVGLGVNGNTTELFSIDGLSGEAQSLGQATVTAITGATSYGVDFNPTVDRLRVVNNLASDGLGGNANNFRLNPNNGALVAIDPDHDFTGLPGGNANVPEVAIAYSNNFHNIGGTTTIYGIVSGGDRLVINGGAAPGFPTLMNMGLLGSDTSNNVGFDITGGSEVNEGFAVMEVGGTSQFYSIDLATGLATLVGTVGDGTMDLGGLTMPFLQPIVQLEAANFEAEETAETLEITVNCIDCDFSTVTVDISTGNDTARAGLDYLPVSETLVFDLGETSQIVPIFLIDDFSGRGDRSFNVTLSNPTNAVLGDPASATVTVTDDDPPGTGVASSGGCALAAGPHGLWALLMVSLY